MRKPTPPPAEEEEGEGDVEQTADEAAALFGDLMKGGHEDLQVEAWGERAFRPEFVEVKGLSWSVPQWWGAPGSPLTEVTLGPNWPNERVRAALAPYTSPNRGWADSRLQDLWWEQIVLQTVNLFDLRPH